MAAGLLHCVVLPAAPEMSSELHPPNPSPSPKKFCLPGMMTSGNPNFLVIANPLLNIIGFSLLICSMSPRRSCREMIRPAKTKAFSSSEPHPALYYRTKKDIKSHTVSEENVQSSAFLGKTLVQKTYVILKKPFRKLKEFKSR